MTQALATTAASYPLLIEKAVEGGNLEIVSKMMDLQDRHDRKEAKKAFDSAKAMFKKNTPTIVKDKTGNKWKYANLVQAVEKATPILSEYGLSSDWSTISDPAKKIVSVTCNLTHVDGHAQSVTLTEMYDESGSKNRIQSMASAVSYLERYTFMAITGLAAGDQDDDGYSAAPERHVTPLIQSFIMANDCIGVHLMHLQSRESDDAQIQLGYDVKSGIGDGLKSVIISRCTEMNKEGEDLFAQIQINSAEGNSEALAETVECMTTASKRLLKSMYSGLADDIKSALAANKEAE